MCGFPCALEIDIDHTHIVLRDMETGSIAREWRGRVARHIIDSDILPRYYRRSGRFRCDRALFWHVALAATAAQLLVHDLN